MQENLKIRLDGNGRIFKLFDYVTKILIIAEKSAVINAGIPSLCHSHRIQNDWATNECVFYKKPKQNLLDLCNTLHPRGISVWILRGRGNCQATLKSWLKLEARISTIFQWVRVSLRSSHPHEHRKPRKSTVPARKIRKL